MNKLLVALVIFLLPLVCEAQNKEGAYVEEFNRIIYIAKGKTYEDSEVIPATSHLIIDRENVYIKMDLKKYGEDVVYFHIIADGTRITQNSKVEVTGHDIKGRPVVIYIEPRKSVLTVWTDNFESFMICNIN